jgi:cell division transport system ATP-binding protein
MISFKKVSKKYPRNRVILDSIDFDIQKGEFVYIIGPSGAGKTTILSMLIGETKPTTGKIVFEDHEIQKFSKKNIAILRRKIRMVFQDFKILFDRTVSENVMLSLYILGKKEPEARVEAEKVLKRVGLSGKENFFPVQLSAGELQRVGIARALAGGSEVLIADEPTGNLDPKNGEEIIKLLEEINQTGTTVLMTTHNASLVDRTKKRVIAIANGKIIRDTPKGKYYEGSS